MALERRFFEYLVTQADGRLDSALEQAAGTTMEPLLRDVQTHVRELSSAIDTFFTESGTPSTTPRTRGRKGAGE